MHFWPFYRCSALLPLWAPCLLFMHCCAACMTSLLAGASAQLPLPEEAIRAHSSAFVGRKPLHADGQPSAAFSRRYLLPVLLECVQYVIA